MIWLYLTIAFIIGVLVGWSLCMNNDNMRCPDKSLHDFEYIGTDTITETVDEGTDWELGGFYSYDITVKKYRCKKCGYIKTEK